ncbi:menaquinol-cytochrome c reductase cytochrome b/c subunit [Aquisalibacillus elongatus]|uniref:Menaquinol-cytochrome c reductase cytochrome b/c subunit n=1 Tax=Aquisalibacillus elongatus TaxID=485577 RepID=A0A3N5C132_9BACI|nr:menaquinol-cytochrome c reductase cytochrome b/c subunit [Aquisalibacillus elongatus]RPF55778.1 menaquinol-cytochrome c reductase cytochrome b/c subunit [Aquisalibacillus elongatus]
MQRGKGMKFVEDSRVLDKESRNKIPKDYSEYPGRTEAFWPNFLLKEWLVGAVFLIGFLCLVAAHPSPLEQQADPNNASYIPLPDWYFLFLYELLKYEFAAGDYVVIGTVVIPGLAFGALLIAPFLDRGPERRPSKRPIATGLMLLGVIATIWLTYESVEAVNWEDRANYSVEAVPDVEIDEEDPGYEVYQNNCMSCHGGQLEGNPASGGPSLVGIPHGKEALKDIAVNGVGEMPANMFEGTDEELDQLAEFIISVNEQANGEGEEGESEEESE